jgi:hypothetical protein
MADQDVIICIGSSNMAGFLANLYEVDAASYLRWFSQAVPGSMTSFTSADAGDLFTSTAHGLTSNQPIVFFSNGGTLSGGITAGTVYYAISIAPNTFQVATQPSGSAVALTSNSSGSPKFARSSVTQPYSVQMEGTRMWTPRRPYASNKQRTVASVNTAGANDTVTYSGTAISPTPVADQWTFILSGTGRSTAGLRRVVSAVGNDVTVSGEYAPTPVAGDAFVVLPSSHTISAIDSTATIITRTETTVAFDSNDVDRYVLFLTPTSNNNARRITAVTSTTITLDGPLTGTLPSVGTGFVILDGANSVEDLDSMQPPKAVLQSLTVALDDVAPVYLTGLEYRNYDFTPATSPREAVVADESVNCLAELTWSVRSKTARPLVALQLGVSASMISPFKLQPDGVADNLVGPLHDFTNLDFHPSSPNGIYPILTSAISSMRTLIESEGNTMKVRGIFINLFDNDPTSGAERTYRLRANTELLRDALRTYIGDDTIPWIMSGPCAYAGGSGHPISDRVYDALFGIADDDPNSGVVDTRNIGFTFAYDNLHLSALSQIILGQEFFRVWEPIHDRLVGPTADGDLVKIAMCNRALTAIGETPNITSLDPPEGSVHAEKCLLLFDQAAEFVTTARHWSFADERVELAKVRLLGPIASATSNLITVGKPHGLVTGSPVSFVADGVSLPSPLVEDTTYYATRVTALSFAVATSAGGSAIDLTTAGGNGWEVYKESDRSAYRFMYAVPDDCFVERAVVPIGAPDDWNGTDGSALGRTELGSGFVTASVNGLNQAVDTTAYGERQPIPFKRAKNAGGEMVIYTDLDDAELVYTARLDDSTQWPPDWKQAVELVLTSYLCASVKRDQKAAMEFMQMAQFAIGESARVDSQRAPVMQRNRFPFAR